MNFTRNNSPKNTLDIGNRFMVHYPSYVDILKKYGWEPLMQKELKRKDMNYAMSFKLPNSPGYLIVYWSYFRNEPGNFFGNFLGTYVDENKKCLPSEILVIAKQMEKYYKDLIK